MTPLIPFAPPSKGVAHFAGYVIGGGMKAHGSDGIPCTGGESEYATQLWLEDPSVFWLHPEGPLSDTTPDEYRAKQAEIAKARDDQNAPRAWANQYQQYAGWRVCDGLAAYHNYTLGPNEARSFAKMFGLA